MATPIWWDEGRLAPVIDNCKPIKSPAFKEAVALEVHACELPAIVQERAVAPRFVSLPVRTVTVSAAAPGAELVLTTSESMVQELATIAILFGVSES
jgi:hypothetical protein